MSGKVIFKSNALQYRATLLKKLLNMLIIHFLWKVMHSDAFAGWGGWGGGAYLTTKTIFLLSKIFVFKSLTSLTFRNNV